MKRFNEHEQLERIKTRFTVRVDAAMARWAHRKGGGQSHRSIGSARREARMKLLTMGFTAAQAGQIISDLYDLVVLERASDED
jgi:hypothetical protein